VTFNAKMVTLAREAAGLTQDSLAHEAGISQGLISRIEHGLEEPSEGILSRMALACNVPLDFFRQDDEILGESIFDFFHKKRLTLPAKPLRKANAMANVSRMEALRLLKALEFSDARHFPYFSADEYPPEEASQAVRATWRVRAGPLPNLVALIEAAAVPVFAVNLGHEKLSAISMPGLEGRHIIILNSQLQASAQRFALAHELGHLVMHHGTASADMERDADAFAAELLMPAEDIRPELRGLRFRDLGILKPRWRVSLAALIRQAHRVGAISDRQYRTFNMQLSGLPGGRKHEPGEFDPEQPRLMRHILEHYQHELGYSTDEVLNAMVVTQERFGESYLGRPNRRLRAVGAQSRQFPVALSDNEAEG
jgi:Zn-dependent peptidase ImmA (M78 family)/transcriptional regulator with XRE-family HTH domain